MTTQQLAQSPITDDDLRARWRRDFDAIHGDVVDLAIQRYHYREIRKVLEADEARFAEMDGTIFEWLAKMYAHSAAVAVRKQVDGRPDTICLRQLLVSIAPRAHLITRAAFVARAGDGPDDESEPARWEFDERRRWLDARFTELVGAGESLSESAVRTDLDHLAGAAAQIQRFVNKTIAHRDREAHENVELKGIRVQATWEDLNGAIDTVEQIVQRYNELLGAPHARELVPTFQFDWFAPLRIPWLLDERARRLAGATPAGTAS